jgi:hypothetical protein
VVSSAVPGSQDGPGTGDIYERRSVMEEATMTACASTVTWPEAIVASTLIFCACTVLLHILREIARD